MKVAIIGGGAAGLACAAEICHSEKNVDVTVFEAKDRVGKKILATGNGRCNMMNLNCSQDFFSRPYFVRPALKSFNAMSNLRFFASMGLYTRHDDEGRVYPMSNQASSVLDVLRTECDNYGVKTRCEAPVSEIIKKGNKFVICGEKFDFAVLACGSKACVKGFNGYELLKSLGHNVIAPRPSLTKICVKESRFTKSLKGIRCKAEVSLLLKGKSIEKQQGEILFNEYGISGICVMQLSAFIARNRNTEYSDYTVQADFVPEIDAETLERKLLLLAKNRKNLKNEYLLSGFLPKKLGEMLLKNLEIDLNGEACELTQSKISKITRLVKSFSFSVENLKGFDEAQVVSGGADTAEFDSVTLESKKVRGLYCCGEILDVDGLCGGYNLLWAWSSGRVCARSIVTSINPER